MSLLGVDSGKCGVPAKIIALATLWLEFELLHLGSCIILPKQLNLLFVPLLAKWTY